MLVAGEARRYSAGQGSVIERDKKLQRKNWREDDKGEVEGTQKRKKKNTHTRRVSLEDAKDAKDEDPRSGEDEDKEAEDEGK